ncbi:hypothetical protein SPFM6_00120 [Salmonella phage SPFM6]|nr:hypothetical protein SPFM6_00120 [Salmonella phage SPFM6]
MADNKRQIRELAEKRSPFTVAQCKALLAAIVARDQQYIQADTAPEYWLDTLNTKHYIEFEGSHFQADESSRTILGEDVQKMLLELDHRYEDERHGLEIDLDEIRGNLKSTARYIYMSEIEANFTLKRTKEFIANVYHLIEGMSDKEALARMKLYEFMERIGAQDQGRTGFCALLHNEEIRARYFQRDLPIDRHGNVVRTWPD